LHSAGRWENPMRGTIRRSAEYNSAIQQIENQLCSAEDLLWARNRIFSLSPPQKRRRGPGRGGVFYQFPLSPTLSPLVPRRERESKCRKRFECRTQLIENLRYSYASAPRDCHNSHKPALCSPMAAATAASQLATRSSAVYAAFFRIQRGQIVRRALRWGPSIPAGCQKLAATAEVKRRHPVFSVPRRGTLARVPEMKDSATPPGSSLSSGVFRGWRPSALPPANIWQPFRLLRASSWRQALPWPLRAVSFASPLRSLSRFSVSG